MRTNKIIRDRGFGVLALALSAASFGLTGCDDTQPPPPSSTQSTTTTRNIYWTAVDSATNQTVVRSTTITEAQAHWLVQTRLALKAGQIAPAQITAVPAGDLTTKQSAVTVGSTDWADCVSYDWFLVTSGADFSGDFFCAEYQAPTNTGNGVQMPFLPAYFDSAANSTAVFNLCTSATNCDWFDCCGDTGGCGTIWHTYHQNSGSGDISPPSNVQYIRAQSPFAPC